MKDSTVTSAVEGVTHLRGLFITAMPDCLLFDTWMHPGEDWVAEEIAPHFGDLVRSNRAGLRALNSWTEEMQVTIEAADRLVILRELGAHFVVGMVFDSKAPLGMVRLQVKQVLSKLDGNLPNYQTIERPRAVRAIDFLQRYAPDPHAVLLRLALQTGITLDKINAPQSLRPEEGAVIEESIREILGLESLAI